MARQALGEEAEVPSGNGLQATVAEAKERQEAIQRAEQQLVGEEHAIIDANLRFFDELAEAASRKAEAELATAIEAAKVAESAIRAPAGEWSRVRIARIRQGRTPMAEVLAPDFGGSVRELEKARGNIWPGKSKIRWQEFRQWEVAPLRRATNREPLLNVVGR